MLALLPLTGGAQAATPTAPPAASPCAPADAIATFPPDYCRKIQAKLRDGASELEKVKAAYRSTILVPLERLRAMEKSGDEFACAMGRKQQEAETIAAATLAALKEDRAVLAEHRQWEEDARHQLRLLKSYHGFARCYVGCKGRAGSCAKKCGLSVNELQLFFANVDVSESEYRRDPAAVDQKLAAAERFVEASDEKGKSLLALYDRWAVDLELSQKLLAREREVLAKGHPCEKARLDLAERVKAATVQARAKERVGTGFYVRAEGKKGDHYHFVTAHHVPGRADAPLSEIEELVVTGPATGGQPCVEPTASDRGMVDWLTDVASISARANPAALPVVKVNERPEAGQELQISGYPAYGNREFVSHVCTFDGYVADFHASGRGYLLRCPSASASVRGMSGGAVTDAQGRVWGVISAEYPGMNAVIVAPVGAKPDGKLAYGVQKSFESDRCFSGARLEKVSRCTVTSANSR